MLKSFIYHLAVLVIFCLGNNLVKKVHSLSSIYYPFMSGAILDTGGVLRGGRKHKDEVCEESRCCKKSLMIDLCAEYYKETDGRCLF